MAQCEGAVAAPYDFSIRYYKCLANYFCWWVQTHKKLSWEYCLVNLSKTATCHTIKAGLLAEVYACAKKKHWRAARGIRNTVTLQREIEKFDTTMLKIPEPITKTSACLEIPQYQNSRPQLHKYRMKICQTPQYRKLSQCKVLKM